MPFESEKKQIDYIKLLVQNCILFNAEMGMIGI